ncbi:PIN domain-containing protein [Streptomyces zaomyceticus]|uniref:PIN domain-containing protein n=1 Tax=Streptomyces zaomyceticus TaxID=68286 RepID=UPI00365A5D87
MREHWRDRYAALAEVIETSPAAYQEAMFREANLIAPCKAVNSGKSKTGSRDAAIWLTAVEYAREHEDETVYFVSNNTEDFGDGTSFPEPLNKDIAGMEDRFFLFTSLDGVLKKFATEVDASIEEVRELLGTEGTRLAIVQAAWGASFGFRPVVGRLLAGSEGRLIPGRRWHPTVAVLDEVLEVSGRQVDGHVWFTASVRWLLTARQGVVRRGGRLAYAWETRILLSPTADKGITVLDFKQPGPIPLEDVPKLPVSSMEDELSAWLELAKSQRQSTPEFRNFLHRLTQSAWPVDPTHLESVLRQINSSPGEPIIWNEFLDALEPDIAEGEGVQ